jgi:hypothetical protein
VLSDAVDVPVEALQRVGGDDRTRAVRVVDQCDRLGPSGHGVQVRQTEERALLFGQRRSLLDRAKV